jgi:hypothetical protein
MLKCGQKDNKNYTFGVRNEQIKEAVKDIETAFCPCCGKMVVVGQANYCSRCGEKL